MANEMGRCLDCRKLNGGGYGLCLRCKELGRVLFLLHKDDCALDQPGKELRVELYAAVVARGGRLFEGGRQP